MSKITLLTNDKNIRTNLDVNINFGSIKEALGVADELKEFANKLKRRQDTQYCWLWAEKLADLIENKD